MSAQSQLDQGIELLEGEIRRWLTDVWGPGYPPPGFSVGWWCLQNRGHHPEDRLRLACQESVRRLRARWADSELGPLAADMYWV